MSTDPEQGALANRVRDVRASRGLTQQQVANSAGIERVALADVEQGRRRITALELRYLAGALRTTPDELLDQVVVVARTTAAQLVAGLTPTQIDLLATYARFLLWRRSRGETC